MKIKHTNSRSRSRGFTLVEVLVALLILAIGLLGLAALQAQSLKFNHDALVRSEATLLAYELMDQMRANRVNANLYAVPDPDGACDPTALNADGAATAIMDLQCWFDNVAALLPAGRGAVAVNGADPNMIDITLQWSDRTNTTAGDCTAISRVFAGGVCFITQTWTIFP